MNTKKRKKKKKKNINNNNHRFDVNLRSQAEVDTQILMDRADFEGRLEVAVKEKDQALRGTRGC